MSRHRNIRRMNYDEECEGFDDVYGRSVEDDPYCVSPSTASQFMYDRNAGQHAIAAFFPSDDIPEEEDGEDEGDSMLSLTSRRTGERQNSLDNQFPDLNPMDEARLRSCLDEIRNIVGDSFAEKTLIDAVINNGFHLESALHSILEASTTPSNVLKPREELQQIKQKNEITLLPETVPLKRDTIDVGQDVSQTSMDVVSVVDDLNKLKVSSDFFGLNVSQTQKGSISPKIMRAGSPARTFDGALTDSKESAGVSNKSAAKEVRDAALIKAAADAAEAEYVKVRGDNKQLLNMVVIGHVDAGKSTLMGHLLWLLGAVNKKQMHKYEQESKKIGKSSFMYAWVLDETGEERARGVTMDVGYSRFETTSKVVTLLDAPGHKDFIPNMITGAAQADVATLVVDATRGEFETGFDSGGQTREHALLVRSLGVSQLLVAVNKLDTVSWSQERYVDIVKKLGQFLKQAGFKETDIIYVPCSGLTGENLIDPSTEEGLAKWYSGPTLLDQIDAFRSPERPVTKPFRLCISDVFKGQSGTFSVFGKVETGVVRVGDRVSVMPLCETATIKGIAPVVVGGGEDASPYWSASSSAFAGDQVILSLSNVDIASVSVGNVLCDTTRPIRVATRFIARIVVFNIEVPITKGFQAVLHYQALCEPIVIKKLINQLHKSTGEAIKKKPRYLTKQSNAVVELETNRPICIEMYKDVKEMGRFMLRSAGATVAAGIVNEIL